MPMVAQQAPYTLLIVDDNEPLNPRKDCEPFGKMVCWHRRYKLGDDHGYSEPRDFLQGILFEKYSSYSANLKGKDIPDWFLDDCLSSLRMSELIELVTQMENMVILPLYLYDHGGITMNTGGFSCPWDSGQVGWIYADSDMIKRITERLHLKHWQKQRNCSNPRLKNMTII